MVSVIDPDTGKVIDTVYLGVAMPPISTSTRTFTGP
ncbi:MAG: hypothetical protein F6Q13_00540 [Mycobacterium sp.]|nr:MAG: hypothetical protein F6Q13_00540 [Mycobacterium sp.]